MHFQCITHSKFFKTTSVILPAKVKKISNPIFTSDLEIGFLASRDGSSGHLLKLGLKVSRPLLVKLEIEAVIFCRLYKIHHGLKLQKTRSMPFRNSHQKTHYSGCGSPQNSNGSSVGHRHWDNIKIIPV